MEETLIETARMAGPRPDTHRAMAMMSWVCRNQPFSFVLGMMFPSEVFSPPFLMISSLLWHYGKCEE